MPADGTDAGSSAPDTGRGLTASWVTGWADGFIPTVQPSGAIYTESSVAGQKGVETTGAVKQPFKAIFDSSRVWGEHSGNEFVPQHIWTPYVIYLGLTA